MQSFPSSLPHAAGVPALVKALAPAAVQVTYCAGNALPYRVEWQSPRGPVMFFGLTPDEAANDAQAALARGLVPGPKGRESLTDPAGNSAWAEAMREMIADIDADRAEAARVRPVLRIVRGGAART